MSQTPSPSVGTGFGIDTSIVEVRDIVRLTRAYLARPDSSARSRGLWSSQSAFDLRYGDLAQEAYQGFPATIIGVSGRGTGDSVFVVKVIYATADSTRTEISPLAVQRLYAIRAPGSPYGWQFSAVLPRLTADWPRFDAGRITFWYAPSQRQSRAKARRASQFVDSVAHFFGVAPPGHINAYLTATMDDGERLLGLDFFPDNSGPGTGFGGRGGWSGITLLGDPRVGEAYLHELVHVAVGRNLISRNSVFAEGIAVWLGGSENMSPKETYAFLLAFQRSHPKVSLSDLLVGTPPDGRAGVLALYATRGLIVDSIYRQSGIEGVKRLGRVEASDEEMVKLLPSLVGANEQDINEWWRAEARRVVNH